MKKIVLILKTMNIELFEAWRIRLTCRQSTINSTLICDASDKYIHQNSACSFLPMHCNCVTSRVPSNTLPRYCSRDPLALNIITADKQNYNLQIIFVHACKYLQIYPRKNIIKCSCPNSVKSLRAGMSISVMSCFIASLILVLKGPAKLSSRINKSMTQCEQQQHDTYCRRCVRSGKNIYNDVNNTRPPSWHVPRGCGWLCQGRGLSPWHLI